MSDNPLPAFPFIELDANGAPRLVAVRCRKCDARYAEPSRIACARCGARSDDMETFNPALSGTLHSASIVRRGYPGTPVPFISAVVDIDDGPVLKGMLRSETFDESEIVQGRRVEVVFDDALGRTDAAGNSYLSHFFVAREGDAR